MQPENETITKTIKVFETSINVEAIRNNIENEIFNLETLSNQTLNHYQVSKKILENANLYKSDGGNIRCAFVGFALETFSKGFIETNLKNLVSESYFKTLNEGYEKRKVEIQKKLLETIKTKYPQKFKAFEDKKLTEAQLKAWFFAETI